MRRPKFLTSKFIECAIRFVVYFLAVALTPFLAKPIAPLFDWAGYGLMRPMFVEIFTIIFWWLEWWLIFSVTKKVKQKREGGRAAYTQAAVSFLDNDGISQENGAVIATHFMEKGQKRKLTKAEEREFLYQKAKREKKVATRAPLPLKNVFLLTAISVACIFIISAVTGFKVKPIYDIGEKVTGYEMYNKGFLLGQNFFKCFWILGIVKASRGMAEELVYNSSLPESKHSVRWLIELALLLIFGLFDVFTSAMVYPLTVTRLLVGLTYILFYMAFVPVQELTEGSDVKAFLLIVLIYIF